MYEFDNIKWVYMQIFFQMYVLIYSNFKMVIIVDNYIFFSWCFEN